MGEKNILAFFKGSEKYRQAAGKLEKLGNVKLKIDQFQKLPGEGAENSLNPLSGQAEDNSQLTLGFFNTGPDIRALMSADLGGADLSQGQKQFAGHDVLLTVVVDESKHHQALEILKEAGAII